MPPREAKGRYLTREYMADADFWRSHDAATRELYMLLALFSDDAGWLEWDPDYLTFAIYRYVPDREEAFAAGVDSLTTAGRLAVYKCGHALMRRVAKSPRSGGQEFRVRDDHESRCKSTRSRPKSSRLPNLTSTSTLTLPNPRPLNPEGAPAHVRGGRPKTAKEVLDETWGSKRKAGR